MIFRCELQCLMLTLIIQDLHRPLPPAQDTSQWASTMTANTLILCVKAAFTLCFRPCISQGGTLLGSITFFS